MPLCHLPQLRLEDLAVLLPHALHLALQLPHVHPRLAHHLVAGMGRGFPDSDAGDSARQAHHHEAGALAFRLQHILDAAPPEGHAGRRHGDKAQHQQAHDRAGVHRQLMHLD